MTNQSRSSVLFYFTAEYPFGSGEQFIKNEIDGLCKKFDEVVLIPFDTSKKLERELPSNCKVEKLAALTEGNKANLFLIFRIWLSELISSNKKAYILKNARELLSSLKQGLVLANKINSLYTDYQKEQNDLHFYSTWMNENALALAILSKKGRIKSFSFKMRGYDLFDERRKGGYMPFRRFIFTQAKTIMTMSKQGAEYLKEKRICSDKIFYNYPGINSLNKNEIKEGVFTLASCSGLVQLKRVTMIAKALKHIPFKMKWVHFGDGPERQAVLEAVRDLPAHIEVDMKGNVSNDLLREFYINEKIDGFIHVSETEGFGYAIIEAYSAAIPAILYPAGAVNELIRDEFAYKVNDPLSPESLAKDIECFKDKFELNREAKSKAFHFYEENFQVEPNVQELYNYIVS